MEEALKALEALTGKLDTLKSEIGNKAGKTEIESISEMIKSLSAKVETMEKAKFDEALNSIKKQLEEVAADVNTVKQAGSNQKNVKKSFGQQVIEKLKEAGISSKSYKKGTNSLLNIEASMDVAKVAGTFTTSNVDGVGTNSIPFSLAQADSGLTRIVKRRPYLMDIANVSPTNKLYVQWAEQANQDGDAGETTEGSTKNQIDFDWVEKSAKVEKVTAFIKVSKEALDDLDGLANEIDTELREEIMLKVDADLLSGDGTSPTIAGLLTMDTAYSAGSFASSIVDPNFYDVLRTAIDQVVVANFVPNYIIMHPTDVAKLDLAKAPDGHYVMPPFKSATGMEISGVRIIENTGQTVDKFTVGDFTKFNIRVREGLTIDVGLDGNDFTKNLVTVLGEIRLASYVKTNHQGAFVSGDFSDAIAALDSGS